ncbi:NAD(P)/FAD-dependent oxidoreductase [Chloroflexota bacterium]
MAANYDLIVAGAGPGGTAAAKTAVEKGLKVLMLERARTPGDKNMSGSYLFRPICEEIFPGFSQAECNQGQIRWAGSGVEFVLDNDEKTYSMYMAPGCESFRDMLTVFRNETDKWFAEQTVKAGAELKTALVTDVIWENENKERVIGVVTDAGNFEAPVIIDATGLHSTIAKKVNLAHWGTDKVMLGMKYMYKLDPEIIRQRSEYYRDTEYDGTEVEYMTMPMMTGLNPEFWGVDLVASPERGIINVCLYQSLEEMCSARINAHQRMQWYLQHPRVKKHLEGAELVQINFHSLASQEMVGYIKKSYLPGLMIVGDAGGFAQPVDNFGANVAQHQGRLAAGLAAEMKQKNDYSEVMFAKYEEEWRNSFIGEDETPEISVFWRKDLGKVLDSFDKAMEDAFKAKWNNKSYPYIMGTVAFNMAPAIPKLTKIPWVLSKVTETGANKLSGLMTIFSMFRGK